MCIICENKLELRQYEEDDELIIDCSYCLNLTELPDLSVCGIQIELNLEGCKNLTYEGLKKGIENVDTNGLNLSKTNLTRIPSPKNLISLVCENCPYLKELPDLSRYENLEDLICAYCPSLVSIPDVHPKCDFYMLNFSYCPNLIRVPIFNGYRHFSFEGCRKLLHIELPDNLLFFPEDFKGCPWFDYKNMNPNYSSNIKKLKILQESCQTFLSRKRMKPILNDLYNEKII
jgi:hypothetical protein